MHKVLSFATIITSTFVLSKLSSQDEQLDKQKKLLAELAAQLKEQQASLDEKTSLLATQQKKIDNIIGVKADVIEVNPP